MSDEDGLLRFQLGPRSASFRGSCCSRSRCRTDTSRAIGRDLGRLRHRAARLPRRHGAARVAPPAVGGDLRFRFTTGTLLSCDAWFDVTTASGRADTIIAIASAVLLELPLATLLFAVAHHLQYLTLRRAQAALGILDAPSALHKLPLFGVPREPATGKPAHDPNLPRYRTASSLELMTHIPPLPTEENQGPVNIVGKCARSGRPECRHSSVTKWNARIDICWRV